jgi:hypothetical protein
MSEQEPQPVHQKTPVEVAAQISKITHKLIERAQDVPAEYRQDGPHYGSPGIRVGKTSMSGGTQAGYGLESRVSVGSTGAVTLETWDKGDRSSDHTVGTDTTIFPNGLAAGSESTRTPYGSIGGPAERPRSNAAKTLGHLRSEVSKARARNKQGEASKAA